MKKILIVIDYQNDFVTGSLANPAAAALEEGICAKVEEYLADGGCVIFTRDTHGPDYLQTREGRFLPVAHCIKGTPGWHLYGGLAQYELGLLPRVAFVNKPTFGAASLPGVVASLCNGAPDLIEICGVVTDICVVSNAILLHSTYVDAEVVVHRALCAAASEESHTRALALLEGMGYTIAD